MKYRLIVLIVVSLFAYIESFSLEPQKLSENMQIFLQSSEKLNRGINQKDKDFLSDASEGFLSLTLQEMGEDEYEILCDNPGYIHYPIIIYTDEFCEELRANNFELVEREPIEPQRLPGNAEIINTVSASIMPGGKATYIFTGEGDLELGLPMSVGQSLILQVAANDEEVEINTDNISGFPFCAWNQEEGPINVTIVNPTQEQVSFCIAIR